jgi:predicted aminopeptidase
MTPANTAFGVPTVGRATKIQRLGALALLALALNGCQTVGYYHQAIRGHCRLLAAREPIEELLADPGTMPALRERLQLVLELREFASQQLHLPSNGHYLAYADLKRDFAVWNVYAAPALSLKPKRWWYPIVGSLDYRGYFSEQAARRYAAKLAGQGYDVYVGEAVAYSTLGWFKDPVLNTFIHYPEAELAETLFHELTHQRLFARGDTDFNEAFATTVAQEGVRRWLQTRTNATTCAEYRRHLEREEEFVQIIMSARSELESLYAKIPPAPKKAQASPANKDPACEAKGEILGRLQENYACLKARWGSDHGYDAWFAHPLNNAQLNSVDTYYHLVPAFRNLLAQHGSNLDLLFREARALADLPKTERHQRLAALASKGRSVALSEGERTPATLEKSSRAASQFNNPTAESDGPRSD